MFSVICLFQREQSVRHLMAEILRLEMVSMAGLGLQEWNVNSSAPKLPQYILAVHNAYLVLNSHHSSVLFIGTCYLATASSHKHISLE